MNIIEPVHMPTCIDCFFFAQVLKTIMILDYAGQDHLDPYLYLHFFVLQAVVTV